MKYKNQKVFQEWLRLYTIFLKIGCITFGGGLAMLTLLQKEIVEDRGWATEEELAEYYAIGLCTPGIIAVNVATMIGAKRAGVIGGILATLGFATAPLICITVISGTLMHYAHLPMLVNALSGVRAFVCIMIADAVRKLWKQSVCGTFGICLFSCTLTAKLMCMACGLPVDTLFFIAAGFVLGVLRYLAQKEKQI